MRAWLKLRGIAVYGNRTGWTDEVRRLMLSSHGEGAGTPVPLRPHDFHFRACSAALWRYQTLA